MVNTVLKPTGDVRGGLRTPQCCGHSIIKTKTIYVMAKTKRKVIFIESNILITFQCATHFKPPLKHGSTKSHMYTVMPTPLLHSAAPLSSDLETIPHKKL